jgi:hypothetical protein
MDYETMVEWAHMIAERCKRGGRTEQQTRDEIFNSALVQFSDDWDAISAEAIEQARRVVAEVLPGPAAGAILAVS